MAAALLAAACAGQSPGFTEVGVGLGQALHRRHATDEKAFPTRYSRNV